MLPEPIAATIQVTAVLEKLGIPYLVAGSLASAIHGMVRTTQDSDRIADMRPGDVEPFVRTLEGDFYIAGC
jgi:D-alanine-D-alanine ligase-like ATP-grasp enzyme